MKPYLDYVYWCLISDHSKINTIHKVLLESEINEYYPDVNVESLREGKSKRDVFLKHRFTKYIYTVKNATLEPSKGWVILGLNKIFLFSFPMIQDPWDKPKARPSTLRYLYILIFRRKRIKCLDKAISIQYAWQNYYHFLIDTLPQILLINDSGIDSRIPIIVPHFFKEIKYVQQFMKLTDIINRPIIIQNKKEYIKVKQLYIAKDVFCSKGIMRIKSVFRNFTNPSNPLKIASLRGKKYGRTIHNFEEIEKILTNKGFKIIEPGDYSFKDQVEMFSNAQIIIGVHGAALTNIIFSKKKSLKLLEILPGNGLIPEHYKNICRQLDYSYLSIEGQKTFPNGNFYVEPNMLKEKISEFL
ncbi:MAG: glycosyltransferase family 61 protein [Fulvivirga sp.]|uniref:glycosyltransferase family 61 protein n=1 Tax=Fulvivirga sp. TaxID=1931237 RepID=UPI0032EF24A1